MHLPLGPESRLFARVDPASAPCHAPQDLAPKTPTAFQLEGFELQKRIRVVVTVGEEVREAGFTTTKPDKIHWKIAA